MESQTVTNERALEIKKEKLLMFIKANQMEKMDYLHESFAIAKKNGLEFEVKFMCNYIYKKIL